MAFPLKNLFGKKEDGETPGVGQLVAEPATALAEPEATGSGAFPPGQSPFQQAPPTAAQAQVPSSPSAKPPAFPDSGSVPLHSTARVAPATATESPFISQPAASAPEAAADESPFSAAPVSPPADEASPFGAPAPAPTGAGAVSSPFAAVEASPFAAATEAAPAAAAPEQMASAEAFPVSNQAAPAASSPPIESPFGAQEPSHSPPAPAASEGEIASPFATDSPFASMPSSSGSADLSPQESLPSFDSGADKSASAAAAESPFALAGAQTAPQSEAAEPSIVTAPPETVEPAAQQTAPPVETPPEKSDAASPFAPVAKLSDAAPVEVELPLQLLIKPLGEKVIGFAPEKVPASVMTKIPLDLIKGQLSSGRVTLPLGTVVAGCAERFHKAFVRADQEAEVSVPIPDLYHHLPEGALAPATPEPVVEPEPEPEPEEDLAAIFADEPEPEPSFPDPAPEPEPEPAAAVAEPSITDDFASPFPPVSATSENPVLEEVGHVAPEMPTIEETSPAEVTATSPFATPFTEAAAIEEAAPEEEPEPFAEATVEKIAGSVTPEEPEVPEIEDEPASALPPFSPFSDEPVTSKESTGSALSLPSFFDIATPDDTVSETAKAAEEQALEPFPEPTAFSDKDETPEVAIEPEPEPRSSLPPLESLVPPAAEDEQPEETVFDSTPEEEAPKKLAANPLDAFAEDTSLGDIDSMDELPELGDLDDLFPAEDPTGVFAEDTSIEEPVAEIAVEETPFESIDPFTDFDAAAPEATTDETPPAEDVFSDTAESKLPDLAPIAPADLSNVFDSVPEEPAEEVSAIVEPEPEEEPEPLPPVAIADPEPTAEESESEDLSFGIHESEDSHQTALRALFGVEGEVDAERAVDLAAALPGISACIFTAENSDAIGAGNLDSFASSGPAVFENVRGLVTAMGIDDAACFTIRTSGGTMSFFSEGETCLGVLHTEPRFEPGVREKLTIVARELDAAAPSPA